MLGTSRWWCCATRLAGGCASPAMARRSSVSRRRAPELCSTSLRVMGRCGHPGACGIPLRGQGAACRARRRCALLLRPSRRRFATGAGGVARGITHRFVRDADFAKVRLRARRTGPAHTRCHGTTCYAGTAARRRMIFCGSGRGRCRAIRRKPRTAQARPENEAPAIRPPPAAFRPRRNRRSIRRRARPGSPCRRRPACRTAARRRLRA